jgi:hypothetical protein
MKNWICNDQASFRKIKEVAEKIGYELQGRVGNKYKISYG